MTDSINVRPSTDNNAVPVAVDKIGTKYYPIYKFGYGSEDSITLVDNDNPLPVSVLQEDITHKTDVVTILNEISMKLEILIKYQAMLHKVDLTEDFEWP